ncbi:hypothetical protein EDC01DRAFT_635551 [Geopyxis carbonaria]|nr:hypothetical protein EDC01DRAFT_635551 [Geopyxis carbonaria]
MSLAKRKAAAMAPDDEADSSALVLKREKLAVVKGTGNGETAAKGPKIKVENDDDDVDFKQIKQVKQIKPIKIKQEQPLPEPEIEEADCSVEPKPVKKPTLLLKPPPPPAAQDDDDCFIVAVKTRPAPKPVQDDGLAICAAKPVLLLEAGPSAKALVKRPPLPSPAQNVDCTISSTKPTLLLQPPPAPVKTDAVTVLQSKPTLLLEQGQKNGKEKEKDGAGAGSEGAKVDSVKVKTEPVDDPQIPIMPAPASNPAPAPAPSNPPVTPPKSKKAPLIKSEPKSAPKAPAPARARRAPATKSTPPRRRRAAPVSPGKAITKLEIETAFDEVMGQVDWARLMGKSAAGDDEDALGHGGEADCVGELPEVVVVFWGFFVASAEGDEMKWCIVREAVFLR